ncbi:MAG: hypothetical protein A3B30_02315 [Candidatus Komeilibacteria bacterium RIFCSPLOWO2_01_FULL_52_15]|uniref:Rrf2 family transcriptional regulator n=2 Tax=Candidatus Komeiliibacteriota TaxID=1817908 RepID=A0A1G2BU69_9BACT|nr:MAG: hypothetical protein A2677_03845 [Candidatus Komeilibacteria bacterium RIFCSPHIGHO2_01_FULL_52_14]OGY91900.1 MAG: hypothetical protein A3B30_02315 [Candidatus Komeilibacteria bacterium RIFCSPLOWO2_01_FULL_52_15]
MFAISTKLDYGLIVLRELALSYRKGPRPLRSIARKHGLPFAYVGQIVVPLRAAGFLRSQEGAHGGYELARSPKHITLKEVSEALAPHVKLNRCLLEDKEVCRRKNRCSMSPWWMHFNQRFQKMLSDITLADLL